MRPGRKNAQVKENTRTSSPAERTSTAHAPWISKRTKAGVVTRRAKKRTLVKKQDPSAGPRGSNAPLGYIAATVGSGVRHLAVHLRLTAP